MFADEVPLAAAPAFARRRHLFRRIVLLSTEEVMSRRRIVLSALVMVVVVAAAGWTAVRAFPLETHVVLQAGRRTARAGRAADHLGQSDSDPRLKARRRSFPRRRPATPCP